MPEYDRHEPDELFGLMVVCSNLIPRDEAWVDWVRLEALANTQDWPENGEYVLCDLLGRAVADGAAP